MKDLRDAGDFNYHHFKEKYLPPEEVGFYFPMFKVNPKRYLHKSRPELFDKLRDLKKAGKVIFMVTNSHVGYYDILFPFTTQLVPDAEEIFDFIGMNGAKPLFFQQNDRDFYRVDYSKRDLRSPHNLNFDENKFFLEGNVYGLTDAIKKKVGKEEVRILYFGDNSTGDMECTNHPCWDSAFIYEELIESNPNLLGRADGFDFTQRWGSWIRDTDIHGKEVETLVYHRASQVYSKTFQRVEGDDCLDFLTLKSNITSQ